MLWVTSNAIYPNTRVWEVNGIVSGARFTDSFQFVNDTVNHKAKPRARNTREKTTERERERERER